MQQSHYIIEHKYILAKIVYYSTTICYHSVMKYYINYPRWVRPALIVLIVACTAQIVYSILRLAKLWGLTTTNLTVEITTLVGMVIAIALTIVMLTARFKVKGDILSLKLLGINMLVGTVKISNMLNIAFYTSTNRIYVGYMMDDSSTNILHININPKAMPKFIEHMQSINNNITYTIEEA